MADYTLEYGSHTIRKIQTISCDQEVVYDPLSGNDRAYVKFRITVEGILHSHTASSIGFTPISSPGSASSAPQWISASEAMMRPRQDFLLVQGGETKLEAKGAGESVFNVNQQDVNSGPKPISFRTVKQLGTVEKVQFTIEVCLNWCESNANSTGILYNKWSLIQSYDNNWIETRTIQGQLRTISTNVSPQSFRGLFFPQLQAGFRREDIRVNVHPNGLQADYTITDRQIHRSAPSPAIRFEGHHSLGTNDGVNSFSEVVVRMTGQPTASAKPLLERCSQVIFSRLKIGKNDFLAGRFLIENISFLEHLDRNEVEARVRIRHIGEASFFLGLDKITLGEEDLDQVIDYDPRISLVPPPYGILGLQGAFVSYLQDSCSAEKGYPQTQDTTTEGEDESRDDSETNVTVTEGELQDNDPQYSQDHLEAQYTHYQIQSRYTVLDERIHLPIADTNPPGGTPTVASVPVHGGLAYRNVTVEAQRVGQWPLLPNGSDYNEPYGAEARLIMWEPEFLAPKLTADGETYIYTVRLVARWVLSYPPGPTDTLRTGSNPFDTSLLTDNNVELGDILKDNDVDDGVA